MHTCGVGEFLYGAFQLQRHERLAYHLSGIGPHDVKPKNIPSVAVPNHFDGTVNFAGAESQPIDVVGERTRLQIEPLGFRFLL